MNIKAFLGASCALTLLLSSSAFANALQDDRAWQFESAVAKQYKLNQELARIKLKNGGFKQIFNVTADGASTVYVGNNTTIGEIGQQNNITNVANQSVVSVEGDDNNVEVGQNNQDSSQGGAVGYAIGSRSGDNNGSIGLAVGIPLNTTP